MKRCNLDIISCGSCHHPEIMTRKGGKLAPANFPSYVGVIKHPEEGIILFDTGYDKTFFEATEPFPERFYRWITPLDFQDDDSAAAQLEQMGYSRDDVSAIVISHFHGDHVAGLKQFPNARLFCAKAGLNVFEERKRFSRVSKGFLSDLIPNDIEDRVTFFENLPTSPLPSDFNPFTNAVDLFGDDSLLAVDLPGHCPGHWGLVLKTEQDRYVFLIADAAWSVLSVKNNAPAPRITIKILGSSDRFYKTLSNLHTLYKSNQDVFQMPSHCTIAAAQFEKEMK